MAVRGFFAQNVASGCAFGAFGVTVLPLQQKFHVSLATASLGLALAVLVISLASPLVATMISRFGLRRTMATGVVISGLGYALLAFASNMLTVLFAYALPIGAGLAMFGPFPAAVLASNWFRENPGPALGFVNIPLFLALMPLAGQAVISHYGLTSLYIILASLHLLVLPLVLGVKEAPEDTSTGSSDAASSASITTRGALARPLFWVIVLGAGTLNAAAISGMSHLFAFGLEKGIPATQAAIVMSLLGGASVIGSLLVGMLCGRLGASRTLALLGAGFSVSWLALLVAPELAFMTAAAIVIGACTAGVFPATSTLFGMSFGQASLARVLGLSSLLMAPLTVALPQLAGVLRDATGSYDLVAATISGGSAAIAIVFLVVAKVTAPRLVPAS
ncbi:MFS transporter [Novosphingobium colocasiae]|uniref:MFS transporter n=1 Tax=Novosphingobium colocasiae TaxID=1256513 RepID=UPI00167B9AE3|nr:MFS transporter [Novosphingobium colocasiae]